MPTVTDWLMVIITFVYVVATVFICWANLKTAKASKEELVEMKRQYVEENRARIEFEFLYEYHMWYVIRLVNHGKMTAYHVKINLDDSFIKSLPGQEFKDLLNKQKEKECIIGVNQHYDLYIASNDLRGNPYIKPVTGKLSYKDDTGTYESEIFIDLDSYATFFSHSVESDDILKELKGIRREIEGVKQTINSLSEKKEEEKRDV